MGYSQKNFTLITFFLASVVVQSFGELIMVRHPSTNNGDTRKLTCMSDDDDATLVWNYSSTLVDEPNNGTNSFTSFQPTNPTSGTISDCGIGTRKSTSCFVKWGHSGGWNEADSRFRPMGPVLDYRWEGFNELRFDKEEKLQYVGEVNEPSGTVVFSVRGLRIVKIVLCGSKTVMEGLCIWIIIRNNKIPVKSTILTCTGGVPDDSLSGGKYCMDIVKVEPSAINLIDNTEWRTFRLQWDDREKIINVFKDIEDKEFLKGKMEEWHPVSHILVQSEITTRVRFHFYDYLVTDRKDVVISTAEFKIEQENLCIDLLIGLCSKCRMEINLFDITKVTAIESEIVSGNKTSMINELLTWQPVRLQKKNLPRGNRLTLSVRTIIDKAKESEGHWALDKIRVCQSVGTMKKSTITTHKDCKSGGIPFWPSITCQKLSYSDNGVIDSRPKKTRDYNTSHLQRFLRNWSNSCGSSCENFGKGSSICSPTECSCDRGFQGSDCTDECAPHSYGYNCNEKCGPCKKENCNKVTGYCEEGCQSNEFIGPLCQTENPDFVAEIIELRWKSVFDTNVTLEWTTRPSSKHKETINYNILIENVKLFGCKGREKLDNIVIKDVRDTTVTIRNLHPYARYKATVTPYTSKGGTPKTVEFETRQSDIPTSVVSKLHFNKQWSRIEWDEPLQTNCTTITGWTNVTRLFISRVNDSALIKKEQTSFHRYGLSLLKLDPYTWYKVDAHVIRGYDKPHNSSAYQTASWRTAPAAPSAVKNLHVYAADPDEKTISLRWFPPDPTNGVIQSYHISIGTKEESLNVQKGQIDCKKDYVCYKSLKVPNDVVENITKITVYAINVDVNEDGNSTAIPFVPIVHFERPSKPRNLRSTSKGQGIIELKWAHPTVSYTNISRFDIRVKILKSELRVQPVNKTLSFKYDVLKRQNEYTKNISLPTSTSVRISVVAVNIKNLTSLEAESNISTPDGLAFATGEKFEIKQNKENGTLIDLVVPTVLNATNNSWITFTVVGPSTCPKNQSKKLLTPVELTEWAVYREDENRPKHLTIGANHSHGVTLKCYLHSGETYKIVAVIKDRDSNVSANQTSNQVTLIDNERASNTAAESKNVKIAWLVILPIVVILVLLMFFIWRRSRKNREGTPSQVTYAEILRSEKENTDTVRDTRNLTASCNRESSTPPLSPENRLSLSHEYAVPFVSKSSSVSTKCFEEYARDAAFSGVIATQYTTFPRGLTRPSDYGRLPQNMPKNRNKNLIAYDDTRVVLEKIPGEPHSDYINANYIQGYGEEKAYIATQGPKPNTVNDFWRMIWQQKVLVICMLTNVMKDEEKMCEEYWPAVGSEIKYGDITVSNIEHQVFADYTYRIFGLCKKEETRRVAHLHYTGWPSRGVPMYSQSLVVYLKKIVETLDGRGPVVVHCSEGDGRTGIVILCDMCVRQGIVEREIDVPSVARRMCNSRANMVGSPEQYLFAHVVIAESIMSISTQIPCTDILPDRIRALRKHLSSHVERLNGSGWQERALHSFASSQSSISGVSFNNKLPELIPVDPAVDNYQRYASLIDVDSNYIGAISVDGVRVKNQNLTSQLPSPSGLPDFWRFVAEQNIELIVILQRPDPEDPMFCDVMPGESILVPVPYIQIVTKSSVNEAGIFTFDKLMLTDSSEETPRSQFVTVLTCVGWGCGSKGKPPAAGDLVSLWQASENIRRKGGLSLVLCRDGVTACGLYLAMSFLLERMAVERECDVISAVRAVRRSRPEFVQSLEQFDYLCDAALNYAGCFQTYANFS